MAGLEMRKETSRALRLQVAKQELAVEEPLCNGASPHQGAARPPLRVVWELDALNLLVILVQCLLPAFNNHEAAPDSLAGLKFKGLFNDHRAAGQFQLASVDAELEAIRGSEFGWVREIVDSIHRGLQRCLGVGLEFGPGLLPPLDRCELEGLVSGVVVVDTLLHLVLDIRLQFRRVGHDFVADHAHHVAEVDLWRRRRDETCSDLVLSLLVALASLLPPLALALFFGEKEGHSVHRSARGDGVDRARVLHQRERFLCFDSQLGVVALHAQLVHSVALHSRGLGLGLVHSNSLSSVGVASAWRLLCSGPGCFCGGLAFAFRKLASLALLSAGGRGAESRVPPLHVWRSTVPQ
mmetsp:Transcript_15025/g.47812  ORF Transcript_15025/g.47812 Transcript_15025/m.47812 type:complete len:352 (+) Transcript_15025:68-1123(+)